MIDAKVAAFEAVERQKKLQKLKDERLVEYDRYYQTVLLTLGLKNYLETHARDCRFISAEPCFSNSQGSEIRPDIVLQHNGKKGILCEVKTSMPQKDEHLLATLKQLERYSQEVFGWETIDRTVDFHETLLLCHAFDYDRVSEKLSQWSKEGLLKISNVVLCEWIMAPNPKTAKEELMIRLREGRTSCEELNLLLKKNINVDIKQLIVEVEECKFTRKEPPVEYTMAQLWMHVFSEINRDPIDFEVPINKLLEIVYDYYISWSNIEGEFSQVRERWIKKAMQAFCNIGMATPVTEKPNTYKILTSKSIPKNVQEYVIERLCEKALDEKIPKKSIVLRPEENKQITDFLGGKKPNG